MKCSNPDCNFDTTGLCVEGFSESTDCPNTELYKDVQLVSPDSMTENSEDKVNDEPLSTKIKMQGQTPLTYIEAAYQLKQSGGKVIALVGPVGVGKTTLISSIYEQFHKNNESTYTFGGSKTLFAFEHLCHSARITSGHTTIQTARTSASDGVKFYHLALKDHSSKRSDLLLSDRAGESFQEAANNTNLCSELLEIERADLILFLVDSEKLGGSKTRHITRRNTTKIIKSFQDAHIISPHTNCCIVLTKFDLALGQCIEEEARKQASMIKGQTIGEGTAVLEVSARPSEDAYDVINGISQLIELMVTSKSYVTPIETQQKFTARSFHNLELIHGN